MLPVRSGSPDGAGDGEGRSATSWTGEKKRRILWSSPLGDKSGSTSSGAQQGEASSPDGAQQGEASSLQVQRKGGGRGGQQQEEAPMICSEFVYSAQDEIGCDEFVRCRRKLEAYEFSHFVNTKNRTWDEAVLSELYKRLSLFRIKAYKILTGDPILDDCDTALGKDYPPDVLDWENDDFANRCSGGIFDWVFDEKYLDRADLDDYQRIIPKRNDFLEYLEWDQYRLTFSSYKTDLDYVQYCDEISKKIKWIEGFLDLPLREWEKMFYRAKGQAVKIAAEFPHMTAALAYRGFEEYIWSQRFDVSYRKDFDRIYFEVWKRVAKQEMSFRDALEEVLSKNMFSSRAKRMQAEIVEGGYGMENEFNICMAHIPEEVVEDEKVEKLITDAVYNKFEKPKTYLQYVSKKLDAARCIGLIPSA